MTDAPTSPTIFKSVWSIPIVLGLLTVFSLVAALLGTGIWHVLAWLALFTPVATALYFAIRRK